jgi:hypothetical protein
MTPEERAVYLINQMGTEEAIGHVNWVIQDITKRVTKEYWQEVLEAIKKRKDELSSMG